jgi:hypothetical protein
MKIPMLTDKENKKIDIEVMVRTSFKRALRVLISIVIVCLSIVVFSLDIFDAEKNTFSFTNYGFAIMASYSAICFSWARNITASDSFKIERVNWLATSSLYGGITFLLGSTFKYIYLLKANDMYIAGYEISLVIKWIAFICLLYGVFMFCSISIQILKFIDTDFKGKLKLKLIAKKKSEKVADQIAQDISDAMNTNSN